jgi:hypothetical protein
MASSDDADERSNAEEILARLREVREYVENAENAPAPREPTPEER